MLSSLLQKAGLRPGLALHSTIPKLLMAAAMVGGAGSLLATGSAQAASVCSFGGYAGTACIANTTVLIVGDKKVSLKGLPSVGAGTIDFTQLGLVYAVDVKFLDNVLPSPFASAANPATFSYDIEVLAPSTNYFEGVQLTVNSPGLVTTLIKSETSSPSLFAELTSTGSIPAPPTMFEPIPGKPSKLSILDKYYSEATSGGLSSFTNTFQQAEVPGPLPLMGAGMAFGFSRKLRSRIKASASAKV